MRAKLDDIDRQIVKLLEFDGRMRNLEIARRVGVSEKTIRSRMARLADKHGMRITAKLEGQPSTRMAFLIRAETGQRRLIGSRLARAPNIDNVHMTTGAYDIVALASFSTDSEAFEFLSELEEGSGIREVASCHLLKEARGDESDASRFENIQIGDIGPAIERFVVKSLECSDRHEVLELACEVAESEFGATGVKVILAEPIGAQHRMSSVARAVQMYETGLTVVRGLSDRFARELAHRTVGKLVAGGFTLRALQTGHHVHVPDVRTDKLIPFPDDLYSEEGISAITALPLFAGTEVVGMLSLYYDSTRAASEEQLALVQAFADQVAMRALSQVVNPG